MGKCQFVCGTKYQGNEQNLKNRLANKNPTFKKDSSTKLKLSVLDDSNDKKITL